MQLEQTAGIPTGVAPDIHKQVEEIIAWLKLKTTLRSPLSSCEYASSRSTPTTKSSGPLLGWRRSDGALE